MSRSAPLFLAVALTSLPARAGQIEAVGVLGNSGAMGESLVRVGPLPFDECATGVALDADDTLWLSRGDGINRLSLDGRLIESFGLDPPGSAVDTRTFATIGNSLFFLGRLPSGEWRMFELSMSAEAGERARALPWALPARRRDWLPYILAPQPLGGRLLLACEAAEADPPRLGVHACAPGQPVELLFHVPGEIPRGLAVRDEGLVYLGGRLADGYLISAYRPDGKLSSERFPVACPKTPALPTEFQGTLSLAGGALWDAAHYGFLARLDTWGRGAPGRIVEWHHELGDATQVVGIGGGNGGLQLVAITTAMPEALYLADWDRGSERLRFVRRIGCLPTIANVGLSPDGWATIGTGRSQLWWRWGDPTDAPPRKAELHIGTVAGAFHDGRYFSLAAQYRLDDLDKRAPVPTFFTPRLGERNEARRTGEPVPIARPGGIALRRTPGEPAGELYATDPHGPGIWRTSVWLPELRPDGAAWEELSIAGGALSAPTSIVALQDGRLIVADAGAVVGLAPADGGHVAQWRLAEWGDGPADRFGQALHLSVDGPWMLVSDTDRHRLLWFDWAERELLGAFGETDQAGDDLAHLTNPSFVALRGDRALVADAGSQRVLRLRLRPGEGTTAWDAPV